MRVSRRLQWMAANISAIALCVVSLARAQPLDTSPRRCDIDVINEFTPNLNDRRVVVRVGSFDSRWANPMMTNSGQRAGFLPFRPKELSNALSDDRLAEFEVAFGRDLTDALVKAGYRVGEGAESDLDLMLHAGLTGVNPGNRASRVFGMGLAEASVRVVLADNQGRPASVVNCWGAFGGGLFGTGGIFAVGRSGESLLRDNSRKIAQSLAEKSGQIPKLGRDLASRRRNQIDVAQHSCQTDVWREQPVNRWSLQDATKVLGAFMMRTFRGGCPPIITRGVDAMWFTSHVQRAMRRSEELFARDETPRCTRSCWHSTRRSLRRSRLKTRTPSPSGLSTGHRIIGIVSRSWGPPICFAKRVPNASDQSVC